MDRVVALSILMLLTYGLPAFILITESQALYYGLLNLYETIMLDLINTRRLVRSNSLAWIGPHLEARAEEQQMLRLERVVVCLVSRKDWEFKI